MLISYYFTSDIIRLYSGEGDVYLYRLILRTYVVDVIGIDLYRNEKYPGLGGVYSPPMCILPSVVGRNQPTYSDRRYDPYLSYTVLLLGRRIYRRVLPP